MLRFLRYIIQLILSPKNGWEDLDRQAPSPKKMLAAGFYPLLAVSVATEFLALFDSHVALLTTVVSALADFGAYFIALYLTRLVLSLTLGNLCEQMPDYERIEMFSIAAVGVMVFFQIIDNVVPWNLMILKFLPVYVVLVLSKSFTYLNVRRESEMHFLVLSSLLVVVAPLCFYYLVYMLVK